MATPSVIKLMLSSRRGERFPPSAAGSRILSDIRMDLKTRTAADLSRYFRDEVVRTADVQYAA
jgi:hypothetical protein